MKMKSIRRTAHDIINRLGRNRGRRRKYRYASATSSQATEFLQPFHQWYSQLVESVMTARITLSCKICGTTLFVQVVSTGTFTRIPHQHFCSSTSPILVAEINNFCEPPDECCFSTKGECIFCQRKVGENPG